MKNFCKYCGSPIDGDSLFCENCGNPVNRTPQYPESAYNPVAENNQPEQYPGYQQAGRDPIPPKNPKNNVPLIIGIIVGAVVIMAAAAALIFTLFIFTHTNTKEQEASSHTIASETSKADNTTVSGASGSESGDETTTAQSQTFSSIAGDYALVKYTYKESDGTVNENYLEDCLLENKKIPVKLSLNSDGTGKVIYYDGAKHCDFTLDSSSAGKLTQFDGKEFTLKTDFSGDKVTFSYAESTMVFSDKPETALKTLVDTKKKGELTSYKTAKDKNNRYTILITGSLTNSALNNIFT